MKNKLKFAFACMAFTALTASAQVGIGTTTPDASAALDIIGNKKGLLIPRMITAERTSINSPAAGLQVYDTTTNSIWIFSGTVWQDRSFNTANNGITATNGVVSLGGALTGLTTISGVTDTNKLTITGTGVDNFNIDSGTFSVDGTNNRVGINNIAPTERLDVAGNIKADRLIAYGAGGITTNVAIGPNSLSNNITGGTSNIAIGSAALQNNTTGVGNFAAGTSALTANLTGQYNTAIGEQALVTNRGSRNIAIGFAALRANFTGSNNFAFGHSALRPLAGNSSFNMAFGENAGYFAADGTTPVVTSNSSIFLGYNTKPLADNQANQIVIGVGAVGIGSNSVVLGADTIVTTALKGNVGIGTTTPTVKLDVAGAIKVGNDTTTTPTAGMIRFNSTTNTFEGYNGTAWVTF